MSLAQILGILFIRVWAAYLMVSATTYSIPLIFGGVHTDEIRYLVLVYVTWLTLGAAAWAFARPITHIVAPIREAGEADPPKSTEDFVALGSFLIGLFHITTQAPHAISETINAIYVLSRREPGAPPSWPIHVDDIATAWLVTLVALFLTFRPRQIARLFAYVRTAGLDRD